MKSSLLTGSPGEKRMNNRGGEKKRRGGGRGDGGEGGGKGKGRACGESIQNALPSLYSIQRYTFTSRICQPVSHDTFAM